MMWPFVCLSELCDILDSKRKPITKKDRSPGPYPYYGATGILDYVEGFLFDEQLVLIGEDGSKWGAGDNSAFKIQGKTWVNNHAHVIRPFREKILDDWIIYYLNAENLSAFITGMTVPKLNQGKLKEIPIPLPPIPEQKRIVVILDQAFADIDKARANAEQNLKNARELFDSYLQQVFSQRGDGWKKEAWGDLCCFVRGPFGGSLKKSMFIESGYSVFEQKHAIHDHIEQFRYFIDENKFLEMKRFEVKPGEMIMSCSGVTLGRVSVIPDGAPQGIINQALLKLTAKDGVDIHFMKYWIRSPIFQKLIFKDSGGAAQPNVPPAKNLKEVTLSIPSIKQQHCVVNDIEAFKETNERLVEVYETKINSLDELKKSILQKAFSGELSEGEGMAA